MCDTEAELPFVPEVLQLTDGNAQQPFFKNMKLPGTAPPAADSTQSTTWSRSNIHTITP